MGNNGGEGHIVLARSLTPSFNPFLTYSVTLLSAANFFLSRVERLRPVPVTDESKDAMTSLTQLLVKLGMSSLLWSRNSSILRADLEVQLGLR